MGVKIHRVRFADGQTLAGETERWLIRRTSNRTGYDRATIWVEGTAYLCRKPHRSGTWHAIKEAS